MPTPTNELIWHFLGYLRLHKPVTASSQDYVGGAAHQVFVRFDEIKIKSGKRVGEDEEEGFPQTHRFAPIAVGDDHQADAVGFRQGEFGVDHVSVRDIARQVPPAGLRPDFAPVATPTFHIAARYTLTGPETLSASMVSRNMLNDDDRVVTDDVPYQSLVSQQTLADGFEAMIELARDARPTLLKPAELSPEAFLAMQAAGQIARADHSVSGNSGGQPAPLSGSITDAPGTTNSGHANWAVNRTSAEARPADDMASPAAVVGGATVGQTISTGNNEAKNVAAIIDASDAGSSFIILGSYFETYMVSQINVLMSNAAAPPDSHGSGLHKTDTVSNDAALVFSDIDVRVQAPLGHAHANYNFKVDYVTGNFVEATYLRQENRLSDNDFITFADYGHDYFISTGSNTLVNASRFLNLGHEYDLIIVAGNYHKFASISQTNVLMDDDGMLVYDAAQGSLDGRAFEFGGNSLRNEAQILNNGGGSLMQPMHTDVAALAREIQNFNTSFDMAMPLDWGMPFYGTAQLNVLFIAGDYLKLLAIEQFNYVSDADAGLIARGLSQPGSLLQTVDATDGIPGNGSDGPGMAGSGPNFASGQNNLMNQATIIHYDSQSAFQYLGGEHYREDMLVQTNIIVPEIDDVNMRVAVNDPLAHVSELVAFLNTDVSPETQVGASGHGGGYQAADMMGGILT